MSDSTEAIKAQLKELIQSKYGKCDELLMQSGIIDSLKAVELAVEVGAVFNIDINGLRLNDMATITSLANAISNCQQQNETHHV